MPRPTPRRPAPRRRPLAAPLAHVGTWLRRETVGGALLVAAAALGLIWANSPWSEVYRALGDTVVGPAALHLDLPLATWATDGLLAVFFFVAGLELAQEFVVGELRRPARAAVPIVAAVGGMTAPALIYLAVVLGSGDAAASDGWGVPVATDIAFALAVLAVLGRSLPPALRTFLLTLAIVDDLIAITLIAVVYSDDVALGPLLLAAVPLAVFAVLTRRGVRSWWLLLPLAALTWWLVHTSGVHATVAGVLLGFAVPVRRPVGPTVAEPEVAAPGMSAHMERRWRPVSVGLALPVFAFFAAGVPVRGDVAEAFGDPVTLGVVAGLVVGKPVGVCAAAWLARRLTRTDPDLGAADLLAVSLLAGIGFTVSLLISELAFADDTLGDHARVGVLAASLVSAALAAVVLRVRARRARARAASPAG